MGSAIAEAEDTAVFEEASDDGFRADIFGKARNLRAQTADATHDKIDLYTMPAGFIERVDDFRVDQGIHLHPDRRRAAGFGVGDLLGDVLQDARAQRDRRNGDPHLAGRRRIAGDVS